MEAARKNATYDDLRSLPSEVVGELISGELVVSPRPRPGHANAIAEVVTRVRPPFQFGRGGPGGWIILPEPEIHLGADVVVPDIAGWRRERWREGSAEAAFLDYAPDWVCEVLSPSTARTDRMRKMPLYLRENVGHIWLIDPFNKTLEVFRNHGAQWILAEAFVENGPVRAEPFSDVELELADLWLPT